MNDKIMPPPPSPVNGWINQAGKLSKKGGCWLKKKENNNRENKFEILGFSNFLLDHAIYRKIDFSLLLNVATKKEKKKIFQIF